MIDGVMECCTYYVHHGIGFKQTGHNIAILFGFGFGFEISLYSVSNYETLAVHYKVIQWSSFIALMESQNHPHATTYTISTNLYFVYCLGSLR